MCATEILRLSPVDLNAFDFSCFALQERICFMNLLGASDTERRRRLAHGKRVKASLLVRAVYVLFRCKHHSNVRDTASGLDSPSLSTLLSPSTVTSPLGGSRPLLEKSSTSSRVKLASRMARTIVRREAEPRRLPLHFSERNRQRSEVRYSIMKGVEAGDIFRIDSSREVRCGE